MIQPLLAANAELAKAFCDGPAGQLTSSSLAAAAEEVTPNGETQVVLATCNEDRCYIRLTTTISRAKPVAESAKSGSGNTESGREVVTTYTQASLKVAFEEEAVTAITWLSLPPLPEQTLPEGSRAAFPQLLLCVGFSHGGVTVFSP